MTDHLELPAERPGPAATIAEGRRRLRRRHRIVGSGVAVAAVAVLGVAGWAAAGDETGEQVHVGETAPPDSGPADVEQPAFDVIATPGGGTQGSDRPRAATNAEQYAALWAAVARPGTEQPKVDFNEQVVISMTWVGNGCPLELDGFFWDGATLAPTFVTPDQELPDSAQVVCTMPASGRTVVVALDRAPLEPGFTLHLTRGIFGEEHRLEVDVPAATPDPLLPEPEHGPVLFEVLAVTAGEGKLGRLRSATDPEGYDELWDAVGTGDDQPQLDLAEHVVVSITIADDACPPDLVGFERDGSTLSPQFVEPVDACRQPLIARTFIVALDRAGLVPEFTLHLRGNGNFYEDQNMTVEVPPQPGETTTPDENADAGTLELTVYDMQPTEGFDVGVRIYDSAGSLVDELSLHPDFHQGDGKWLADVDVPAGTVVVHSDLRIGRFDGPEEPDFAAPCVVGVPVPAGAVVPVRLSWSTGCFRSDADGSFHEVNGTLLLVGGPAGTQPLARPGTVTAIAADGSTTAHVNTDDQGRFRLELPAGVYDLIGRTDFYDNGNEDCRGTLEVHEERVDGVIVACQMK